MSMSEGLRFETDADILRRRNYELTILNAIAQALNRSVDLDQALHAALAQVAELLDLRTGWIWLLHEDTGESYLAAAQNLPPALADSPRRMEGTCYCLDTYRAGDLEGAANVNVVTCSRLWGLVDGTEGLRYHASIPLYAHEKQLGVLNVASADWRGLSPEDLRLLHTVGDMLSIAIERARLFARSVQLGAAEERNRLAREIHDTLAQGLSAIALHLETADALLEAAADLKKVREAIHRALALTRANLEEARRSVLDLRAAPLEGRSLTEALAELAKDWEANSEWQVEYEVVGGHRPLPLRVEVGLYRIAQEALTNIAQHAAARRVTLSLVMTPAQVRLMVEDDGRGFEPPQVPTGRYGLIGLNERAKLLSGTLELESSPGVGTRVEVSVPMGGAELKG
jgi:two-component system NarL family sensor kinase